jgi:hypothetical protein
MTITTEFELGQQVWFMCRNAIASGIVSKIEVSVSETGHSMEVYSMKQIPVRYFKERLYATKGDLIAELSKD